MDQKLPLLRLFGQDIFNAPDVRGEPTVIEDWGMVVIYIYSIQYIIHSAKIASHHIAINLKVTPSLTDYTFNRRCLILGRLA